MLFFSEGCPRMRFLLEMEGGKAEGGNRSTFEGLREEKGIICNILLYILLML